MENNLKLLASVNSDTDADIIISKLQSENIIGVKKYSESAAAAKLYCGASSIGVDVYVWTAAYEKALELISDCEFTDDELSSLAENTQSPTEDNTFSKALVKKLGIYTLAIAVIFIILKIVTK